MCLGLVSEELKEKVKLGMIPKLFPEKLGLMVKAFPKVQELGTGGFREELGRGGR